LGQVVVGFHQGQLAQFCSMMGGLFFLLASCRCLVAFVWAVRVLVLFLLEMELLDLFLFIWQENFPLVRDFLGFWYGFKTGYQFVVCLLMGSNILGE
jgi:hypothetical protein